MTDEANIRRKQVKLEIHKYRIPGEWEYTAFIGPLQIRFGNMQQAAWWHHGNYRFTQLFSFGRRVRGSQSND